MNLTAHLATATAAYSRKQAGDPVKLAQIVLRVAASDEPPVRLALGPEAVATLRARADTLRAQAELWSDHTEATNIDA